MREEKEIFSFSRSMLFQCALLFVGICAGLWINGYCLVLVAGITIFTAIFTKPKNVYYQLLFCLPFTMIYKLSPSSTSLFAYVMLAVGVILIFKIRSFGILQLLLILLFTIYIVIGMGNNATTVIKMVIGLILFYIFTKKIKPRDFKNQVFAFTLGMLGSSCIGLLKGSWHRLDMYYSDMNTIYIDGIESQRFTGLYLDPNYYSVSVIFALTLCALMFFNKVANRGVLGFATLALTIFGFLSYSKIFLLAVAIEIVVFFFWGLKPTRKKFISLIFILLGVFILYQWMQDGDYLAIMADRLLIGDISTGRFYIWENYLNYIWSSPKTFILGDGLGAAYRVVGGPHNTFIESVFFLGIVGSAILFVTIISIFKNRQLSDRKNVLLYILPVVFCVMASTLGCLTVNDLMFYCMMMWMSLNFSAVREWRY